MHPDARRFHIHQSQEPTNPSIRFQTLARSRTPSRAIFLILCLFVLFRGYSFFTQGCASSRKVTQAKRTYIPVSPFTVPPGSTDPQLLWALQPNPTQSDLQISSFV